MVPGQVRFSTPRDQTIMNAIELDVRKLLGFRLSVPAQGAKIGGKPTVESGTKAGLTPTVRAGAKMGAKLGGKENKIAV